MQIQDFFINGDMKGAIAYMREHEEFQDILPAYIAIFENCEYRTYDVPEFLNKILLLYQVYYRDVFYCGLPAEEATDKLLTQLKALLDMPDAEEDQLAQRLCAVFEQHGYHAVFGATQGYYGPYVWKDTVPTVYSVELPDGTAEYTVNILKGFVFRSWMDYLIFGMYGNNFRTSKLQSWNTGQNLWSSITPTIWDCCKSFYRKRMKAKRMIVMQSLLRGSNSSSQIRIKQISPTSRHGRWNCFMHIRKKWKKNMGNKKQCPMVD